MPVAARMLQQPPARGSLWFCAQQPSSCEPKICDDQQTSRLTKAWPSPYAYDSCLATESSDRVPSETFGENGFLVSEPASAELGGSREHLPAVPNFARESTRVQASESEKISTPEADCSNGHTAEEQRSPEASAPVKNPGDRLESIRRTNREVSSVLSTRGYRQHACQPSKLIIKKTP